MVGLEVLRSSDLFGGLRDDELIGIARLACEVTYDVGATIFREGDLADNLYIVREGRVAVLINIRQGKLSVVDTVHNNASFGWSAMVPPYIRTGTTCTLEKTRLVIISGQDLRDMCRVESATCYTVMEKLATIISQRLKHTRLQLITSMSD
jgi:CRP/FNR family transcriptional regulator, cyclic AMP receptor protein